MLRKMLTARRPHYTKGLEHNRAHLTILSDHDDLSDLRWQEYVYPEKIQEYNEKLKSFRAGGGRGKAPPEARKPKRTPGLIHDRDGKMVGEDRKAWKKRHSGEPNEEDEVLGNKIGRRLSAYLAKMVQLGLFRSSFEGSDGHRSQLFDD